MSPCDERYLQRIHDFRHLLNGEWHWDVLVALFDQPLRYTDLLNAIRAQTQTSNWPGRVHRHLQDGAFSRTLHRLMEAELVERDSAGRFPFPVTYRLTPTARELLTVMSPAAEWAEAHRDLLIRVQNRRHGSSGE
jgi:DNA-binding HxlR family transcriptional regulator